MNTLEEVGLICAFVINVTGVFYVNGYHEAWNYLFGILGMITCFGYLIIWILQKFKILKLTVTNPKLKRFLDRLEAFFTRRSNMSEAKPEILTTIGNPPLKTLENDLNIEDLEKVSKPKTSFKRDGKVFIGIFDQKQKIVKIKLPPKISDFK